VKRLLVAAFALTTLASLVWVGTPVYIIRPFVPQTTRGMALSYSMRSASGLVTIVALLVGLALCVLVWRRLGTWWGRGLAAVAVLLLAVCAWGARQNHFEWMFAPIQAPEYVDADLADHVLDDELVLGLAHGGEARAYPVRALAYHHLVNDAIAGEPVVATY
jgi:hypothetical protein